MFHRAAGLIIAADRLVPGLTPVMRDGVEPDVSFHLDALPLWACSDAQSIYIAPHTDDTGRPIVQVQRTPTGFQFHYADDTNIWIDRRGAHVWCTWPPQATLEDTATYLTGPVLGFVLRLRGSLALHASAVQIGDAALVLVGPHGAGKSTAAAALGLRGCPVIADDVLHLRPVEGEWLAEPCGAHLRMWPEGAALALGSRVVLPRLTPTWDKRALDLDTRGITAAAAPVRIAAAAFLAPRECGPRVPRLETISRSEALVQLATHSSAAHLLDEGTRASEFESLSSVVRHLQCMRAIAAEDEGRFGAFIDLLHDLALQRVPSSIG